METEKILTACMMIGDKVCDRANPTTDSLTFEVSGMDRGKKAIYFKCIAGNCDFLDPEPDGTYKFDLHDTFTWYRIKPPIFTFNLMDFIMGNLEFYPLVFCLLFLYHAAWDWRLWVTILSVSICAGISANYAKRKAK